MKTKLQTLCAILIVTLFSTTAVAKTKVACVGNSITYGYGLSSPSTQCYPTKLQALLGSDYAVSNFGISARTMLKKGDRPYWVESQYTQAKALKPDIVIIMLGTNDAKLAINWTPHKSEFAADYKAMIKAFRDLSSAPEVWVCKVAPAYKAIWDISNTTIVNEVNPQIMQIATTSGTHLIDIYAAMDNSSQLFQSDGIHPNTNGAVALANYIYNALKADTLRITAKTDTLIAPTGIAYQWYFNGTPIIKSEGGDQAILTPTAAGEYSVGVQLSSSDVTTIISEPINFQKATSTSNVQPNEVQVNVYPNPCTNVLYISTEKENEAYHIKLYSIDGACIYSKKQTSTNKIIRLDISQYRNGLYFYSIATENSISKTGKIAIENNF